MKTNQLLKFAVVIIGAALPMFPIHAQTVTWNRKADGQQQNYPCGGTYSWPDDNSWDISEIDSIACNQTYVVQPSNWDSPNYPNGSTFDVILSGSTAPTSLDIAATLNSLTVQSGAGDINMTSGSSFNVQSYDFQTDGSFTTSLNHGHGGPSPVIYVPGTFLKSAGSGVLDISGENSGNDIYFDMQGGTIQVNSGTLKLSRGDSTGATFAIAANAAADLTNGSIFVNYTGSYGGSGSGAVQLNNGNINIANPGATFNFTGGLFQWAGGSIGSGTSDPLNNLGTMNLVGPNNKEIDGVGFTNSGMMIQTGTGNLQFGNNAYMTNAASGTYDIRSDSGFANGQIENYGTFKKSAGTGISMIWGNNDPNSTFFDILGGTVEVDSGTLMLGRCSNCTGGTFLVAAGAVLDLNSGGIFSVYVGAYNGTGDGQVQLNGGQISSGSPSTTFNFAGNLFQWNGGTIAAGPPFNNTGTMTLAGPGGWGISGGGFHNAGMMIQTGTGALQWGTNAFMTNDASGTYEIRSDGPVSNGGDIENYGTFKKSAGTGISTIWSNDPNSTYFDLLGGTVEVDTGTLMLGRCANCTGANFVVASGAVLDLNSGGIFGSYAGAYTGTGAGQVQINSGQIGIASPGATFNFAGDLFQWNGGAINACAPLDNEGTISIGGSVGIGCGGFTNNGTIKGNGTINGTLTNNGAIAPGNSAGQLNYNGDLELGSTSNLVFEIGGTAQGTQYDWLNKIDGGVLTLNGNLTLTLINNFIPQNSDVFTIVTTQAILEGTFNNVPSGGRLETTGGEGSFKVTYNVTNDPVLSRNVTLSDFQTANPCPTPTGTEVDGTGSIAVNGGSASFDFQVPPMVKGKKMRKVTHFFDYGDAVAGINFEAKKISSLTVTGNHAEFSGTATVSRHHKITWTVDVVAFNCPGMPDQFSIQMSDGYSASGPVTSGSISLH